MTALPSVEPLPPGARPTEPGWYVARTAPSGGLLKPKKAAPKLIVRLFGTGEVSIAGDYGMYGAVNFDFIARIYPDRIGQE